MDTFRASLEVLKWLQPTTVLLKASLVSHTWHRSSSSDELWIEFFEIEGIPPQSLCRSYVQGYRHFHCSPSSLFVITKRAVEVFSLRKRSWVRKITLSKRLAMDMSSSYDLLPDGSMICSGGGEPHMRLTIRIEMDGQVTELREMRESRGEHGIVTFQSCLYVFGGETEDTAVKSCEKLQWEPLDLIREAEWMPLPDMLTPRKLFKPCVYQQQVFLIGGFTTNCEVFSPERNEFLPLRFAVGSEEGECLALVIDTDLHAFASGGYYQWNLTGMSYTRSVPYKRLKSIYGKTHGKVYQNKVYFPFRNLVYEWDFSKLKSRKIYPLEDRNE